MIVVDEKVSAKLHPEEKRQKLKSKDIEKAKSAAAVGRRDSRGTGISPSRWASLRSGVWSVISHEAVIQPLIIAGIVLGALGAIFWVGSTAGAQQREIASEGSASIMASATGASIDKNSEGLPGSTEISGVFRDESVQIPLKDPTTGKTLKTVEALGAEDYSYTIKGTLDDYSISFKKIGSGEDAKSYRYDSKTEKVREITEKDLW